MTNSNSVSLEMQIEDIIEKYPQSVSFFIEKGINPIYCSGPYPTTLEKFLEIKKVTNKSDFLNDLNNFIIKHPC
jgi:hypothetical protein